MKASQRIKEFIKEAEGFSANPYRCAAGVLTIGYGHTGRDVRPDMTIDKQTAGMLLDADIARVDAELERMMKRDKVASLTQNQYDAIVSFAFNLGTPALNLSTLWRKVKRNPGDPTIAGEFNRWVYATAGGVKNKLPGLVKRRKAEAELWNE